MKKLKQTLLLASALILAAALTGCGREDGKQKGTLNTATSGDAAGESDSSGDMSIDEYIETYASDVTLGKYKGIEYEYSVAEVTDEQVQEEVQKFVSSCASYEEDHESKAKIGDTVNIDFVGSVDGVEFEGGNTNGSGYDVTLGSHGLIDDFEDQIVGHVPGETFDVKVTFPEDYGQDNLNGREAVFETTLNYIQIEIEAEYNDELVAANTSYSNVADYEKSIYDSIAETNEARALASAQNFVMTSVMNNATIDSIPEDEVLALTNQIISAIKTEAEGYNLDYETYVYYYYAFDDPDAFYDYVVSVCEETVKEKKIVCAVAKTENITVTAEEVEAYVAKLAEDNGVTEDAIREYYEGEDLMYYALAEKVMNFLMENGVVTDAEE